MIDIIWTEDKRLEVIKNYLNANFVYEVDDIKSENIMLPIKGLDDLGNIIDTNLNVYDVIKKRVKRIFTCKNTKVLDDLKENNKIEVINLLSFPNVLEYNSYLTAEGLLGIIISKTNFNLRDSKVLLLGYGNCGKQIYKLFSKITRIDVDKYDCIEKYDIIINTIPALVIDKKLLKRINGVIFDISSFPYGVDIEYAKELNKELYIEPLIPARYSYYDAGLILAKKIYEILN